MDRSTVERRGERADATQVRRWRFDRLVEVGYEEQAASQLASRRDVDLHAAIELVVRGCPPATAVRILL